jgi:hypothetical protein
MRIDTMTTAAEVAQARKSVKPCPFCGGAAQDNDGGNSTYGRFWWAVGCVDCGVTFNDTLVWDNTEGRSLIHADYPAGECFVRWNNRTPA